jgi:transposase
MLAGTWPRQSLSEHERDARDLRILALYEDGLKIADIAKQVGCGAATVGKLARDCGMPRRISTTKDQAAQILPLAKQGFRASVIAKRFNLSVGRIRQIIQQDREGEL